MTDTLLILQKQLPENIVGVLVSVTSVADKLYIPSFIVGATARDIILEYVYSAGIRRRTQDIDFGVAIENWVQYELLKKTLVETENFRADDKIEQRLCRGSGREEMKIDLVPYGGLERPAGQIAFPPDGAFVMNTNGFAEAYEDAVIVQISEMIKIRVVSLAGLAVLKFVAYDDRPNERQTDLQDIWFLAKNYLSAAGEERLYADTELMKDESFDLRTVGALLLGRDMAKLLTEQTEKIILKHLSEDNAPAGLMNIAAIINFSEKRLQKNLEDIIETLRQLKRGVVENLPKRI